MKLEMYEFSEDLINLRNELKKLFPCTEGKIFTTFQTNKFSVRIADLDESAIELIITSHLNLAKILIYSAGEVIDFDGRPEYDKVLFEDLKEVPCCLDFASKYSNQ